MRREPPEPGGARTPDRRPPRLALRLLRRLLPGHRGDELVVDLAEEYAGRAARSPWPVADVWYWIQVLRPSTTRLGRELSEVRTMRVGRHRVPGVAPKGLFDVLRYEARLAFRSLRQRPGFSTLVVLTLGLGIGANTGIFTVVSGVLLEPLAYPDPDGLVVVGLGPDLEGPATSMSLPDIVDLEEGASSLTTLVGYSGSTATLTGMGDPTLLPVGRVERGLLSTFHLAPVLGRDIAPGESGAAAAAVAVIGYEFWRDHFRSSPDVLGETIVLNGASYEIVGVAPHGFDFPDHTQVWYPRQIDPDTCARSCHTWYTIGRLAAGATVPGTQVEADAIATRLSQAFPETNLDKTFEVRTLQDVVVGRARRGLWLLLGAGLAVLLIACANVANLVLARAEARRGEAAVRAALGATRGRLIASMLSESTLLAVLGGAFGLALALGGVVVLRRLSAGAVPRIEMVTIDTRVLLFTLGLVCGVTFLFGLSPALRASRMALATGMRRSGRGVTSGGGRGLRRILTMTETALAIVLLFGAGLMLRTFAEMHAVDPGFETRRILRFDLYLPEASYPDLESIRSFFRTLEGRIAAQPGVEAVGSIYGAPLGEGRSSGHVFVDGRPEPPPGQEIGAVLSSVGPGYVRTMRIPVIRGRDLTPADDRSGTPVSLVNQAFAHAVFGDADPIGERVRVTVNFGFGSPYWEIVGVVGDVRASSLTEEPVPEIYVPQGQDGPGFMTVNIRSSRPARGLIGVVRSEVRRLDATVPLRNVETVTDAVRRDTASTRFLLAMLGAFAGLALVLAAVGLYGVMAYLVSQRVQEVGVRVALGARPGAILSLLMRGGLGPAAAGVGIGLLLSLAGGQLVEGLLYGVEARDPVTLGAVPLVLLVVAVLAVLVPALRATRVDPASVLRAE